jgi:hypothetical protein
MIFGSTKVKTATGNYPATNASVQQFAGILQTLALTIDEYELSVLTDSKLAQDERVDSNRTSWTSIIDELKIQSQALFALSSISKMKPDKCKNLIEFSDKVALCCQAFMEFSLHLVDAPKSAVLSDDFIFVEERTRNAIESMLALLADAKYAT